MRNFGEELAYWYLRLNGFFLIEDFVLHYSELENRRNADVDILGVRNPFTEETIGLIDDDDISSFLYEIEPKIKEKTVAVISEVKSGESVFDVKLKEKDRLKYAVKRLGLSENVDKMTDILEKNKLYSNEKITIIKIVFSHRNYEDEMFYSVGLQQIESEIMEKLIKYLPDKDSAKFFFPSTLMQFLIWKVKQIEDRRKRVERLKKMEERKEWRKNESEKKIV